jgi:hypothetical protein
VTQDDEIFNASVAPDSLEKLTGIARWIYRSSNGSSDPLTGLTKLARSAPLIDVDDDVVATARNAEAEIDAEPDESDRPHPRRNRHRGPLLELSAYPT